MTDIHLETWIKYAKFVVKGIQVIQMDQYLIKIYMPVVEFWYLHVLFISYHLNPFNRNKMMDEPSSQITRKTSNIEFSFSLFLYAVMCYDLQLLFKIRLEWIYFIHGMVEYDLWNKNHECNKCLYLSRNIQGNQTLCLNDREYHKYQRYKFYSFNGRFCRFFF